METCGALSNGPRCPCTRHGTLSPDPPLSCVRGWGWRDQADHHTHALMSPAPQDPWVRSLEDLGILGSVQKVSRPPQRVEVRTLGLRGHTGEVRVRKGKAMDPQRPPDYPLVPDICRYVHGPGGVLTCLRSHSWRAAQIFQRCIAYLLYKAQVTRHRGLSIAGHAGSR